MQFLKIKMAYDPVLFVLCVADPYDQLILITILLFINFGCKFCGHAHKPCFTAGEDDDNWIWKGP